MARRIKWDCYKKMRKVREIPGDIFVALRTPLLTPKIADRLVMLGHAVGSLKWKYYQHDRRASAYEKHHNIDSEIWAEACHNTCVAICEKLDKYFDEIRAIKEGNV